MLEQKVLEDSMPGRDEVLETPFRRAYNRSVVHQVEVDDEEIRLAPTMVLQ
jgi:hypothetical protein